MDARRILPLVLAAATLRADPEVQALKAEMADRGWIVFAAHPAEITGGRLIERRSERGQLDIYLARPDGSDLRNITGTETYHEFGARFSPDSATLLFRRLEISRPVNHDTWGETGELVIANADGTEARSYGARDAYPWASWSPDMKRIACLYKDEGLIRIFDFQTKELLEEFPSHGIYQQLFWSPCGKRLVGTANVTGRLWNIVSVDLATRKPTVLTRALNCTPDWYQGDPGRVIYSNRNPALFPGKYDGYGLTMLMEATADGKERRLIYGDAGKHVYFGCTSPDDRYLIFADDPQDSLIVGHLRLIRLADAPILPVGFDDLRPLHPNAKKGPVLSLTLPNGTPLRGFEPHWTFANVGGKQ